jgi:hypothetical protein
VKQSVCSTWGIVVANFWYIFSTKGESQGKWQDDEKKPHDEEEKEILAVAVFMIVEMMRGERVVMIKKYPASCSDLYFFLEAITIMLRDC